ncbi:MAG: YraN family protein [Rhodobiaceae bacterium]|jgi:putative endonuclease|nr:YraN family protein [Rhodobiaceae bacterium]
MTNQRRNQRRKQNKSAAKRQADKRGRRAEFWAACVLRLKGYRILRRNYRVAVGEIDLIARRGRVLAFVEVKYRGDIKSAQNAIRDHQWQRIERAANRFVASHKGLQDKLWRFDVMACAPRAWPKHIEDAWRAR